MPTSSPLRTARHEQAYRPRLLVALALSLGVLVGAFRLWPVAERARTVPYVATPHESIPLELIEPTEQRPSAAPPPPPTLPPVEVPDDVPIPEVALDFETLDTAPDLDLALPEAPPGPESDGEEAPPTFVARADRRPQIISPVLPTYPREAERQGIRARIRLRLRVDARGRLQEVEITDRFLLDKKDREERVAEIGYGVEQAVLDAVNRTRFRPGRHEGRPVETYTTMTLSVGV